ncbi:Mu transposase domain-containing protein [Kitasatospora cathayae]|uniref:IS21 family transposase n=1 Tax=Kitasatospora cathayae TaxID=3004092 RepID=A0ABY7QJN3_9ACTN|nr:IS21 family transposase [Kitasatospora sp. HUAS 3-15]WBP92076.1 IS21 family transposase [Kitasatospora sp. HUAS 3-15]
MLTGEEYINICALRSRGLSIAAIARLLGRDRKTVSSYLSGKRTVGVRCSGRDEFERFIPYCRQRLQDDAHFQASALFAELVDLGYNGGYSTFTRALRTHQLRPRCPLCQRPPRTRPGRQDNAEEVHFRWFVFSDPPADWGNTHACILVGRLAPSQRWSAVLTEQIDLGHLVDSVDRVLRQFGGTGWRWRFDRTQPIHCPGGGKLTTALGKVAKHYGVVADLSPARRDADDEAIGQALVLWWQTIGADTGLLEAQESLDRLAGLMDARRTSARGGHDGYTAPAAPVLLALPHDPYPAKLSVARAVSANSMVSYRGNLYAVPRHLHGHAVEVRRRLGDPFLAIATPRGRLIVQHALAPDGASLSVIGHRHGISLERPLPVPRPACHSRMYSPPSPEALAAAEALRQDARQEDGLEPGQRADGSPGRPGRSWRWTGVLDRIRKEPTEGDERVCSEAVIHLAAHRQHAPTTYRRSHTNLAWHLDGTSRNRQEPSEGA